jgi:uncharacterized delta-60 repeat protein
VLAFALTTSMTFAWFSAPSMAQQSGGLDTATYGPYPGLAYGQFPPISAQRFYMHDAIVLPDDRVVASGACTAVGASPAGTRFCLAVWNGSGTTVELYVHSTNVNRVSSYAPGAVAAQTDGKIVATAPCIYSPTGTVKQFCTVRFNADFTSDTGFAASFQNISPSPSTSADSFVRAITLQPDGKIIVAGQCGSDSGAINGFCAARLLPDGNPDSTFGFGGSSLRTFNTVATTSGFDRIKRIALSTAGQIYLGGDCRDITGFSRACVARLNADGSIDQGFTGTGAKPFVLPTMGASNANDEVTDMVVQANGEFVFAGSCQNASLTRAPCALRMGIPNATQFTPGTWYLGAEASTGTSILREPLVAGLGISIDRIHMQPDGKMLALLRYGAQFDQYRIRRYNEDGSRDANWAEIGFDFNRTADGADYVRGVALGQQSSGKVMAMGVTLEGASGDGQARVIRFENRANPGRNCSADIDGDGKVLSTTDGLLLARASLGMTENAVISGAVGAGALRNTWPAIRDFLITQCGMKTIVP